MQAAISRIGFWSGIIAFTATLAYVVFQLLQLYGLLTFPADERLIYGSSLCIVIPFLLEILALHYTIPPQRRFWTHASVLFTTLYAVFVTANYVVQLATVIPMSLTGNLQTIRILQQTPHSMFWNFDALGYIFMGLATAAAVPALKGKGYEKVVRTAFIAHALVTPLISIVYFYPVYSYRLLLLGFPWALTAPAMMLTLALWYRKQTHHRATGS